MEQGLEQLLGAHPKLPLVPAAPPGHFQLSQHQKFLDVKPCPARFHWIPSEISTG